jgi:hypothetical protein
MENQTVEEPSALKQPEIPSQTPPPTFVGNTNDLVPIIGATAAGISALCCLSWGYLVYCLPVVGIVLGAVAVLNAKAAVNPDRTRRWGWVSVGVSGGVLLAIVVVAVCFILLYAGIILLAATTPAVPTPRR